MHPFRKACAVAIPFLPRPNPWRLATPRNAIHMRLSTSQPFVPSATSLSPPSFTCASVRAAGALDPAVALVPANAPRLPCTPSHTHTLRVYE